MSDTIAGIDRDELGRVAWEANYGRQGTSDWLNVPEQSQEVYRRMGEAIALHVRAEIAAKAAPVPAGITLDELRAELDRFEADDLGPYASEMSVNVRVGRVATLRGLISRLEAKVAQTPGADTIDATPCGDGTA